MQRSIPPTASQLPAALQEKIALVTRNPVTDNLMQSVSGLLAVLDDQRQVMSVNDSFLEFLGNNKRGKVLGLRLGEAIACINAKEAPGGCGTGRFCSSCGVANAILTSLVEDKPVERICAANIEQNGQEMEICFQVRASPIIFENQKFIVLLMQDISAQHAQAALERVFFHDIGNILTILMGATENLDKGRDNRKLIDITRRACLRLKNEVEIQRTLSRTKASSYQVSLRKVELSQIVKELEEVVTQHQAAAGKSLLLPESLPERELHTDPSLLVRILLNMLTNAFEATDHGGHAKLSVVNGEGGTTFMIWNAGEIPPEIRPRIFQRHFSTKEGQGRGLGTYSMKLFGEKVLHGKVDFSSSKESGTTFRLTIN